MEFIFENWYIILSIFAVGGAAGIAVYRYAKQPREEQLAQVREWLLWAVTEAERTLGGGTGKLKLRQVYDMFITRFQWIARFVPFELFSKMVDDALVEMRHLLQTNEAAEAYVESYNTPKKDVN